MTNKSYHQYCSIARALDVVGERWTLLIIRNLMLGPKRFSDLLRGLPGLSTNILTDRLKLLEQEAVIMTRFLPPPAASVVYELTERGTGLADVLNALAVWGSPLLGKPQAGQFIVAEGIAFMVQGVFRRASYPPMVHTCNFHVLDEGYDQVFGVSLSPNGVQAANEASTTPDTRLQIALEPLSVLSSKRVQLKTLLQNDQVQVEGEASAIADLIIWVDGE